jgi:membrane fusion protein, multidrug efflux system
MTSSLPICTPVTSKRTGGARTIILTLVILLLLSIMAGCGKEKAAEEKVVNVRVGTVEKRPLKPFVEVVGSLKPWEEVVISSELDGMLRKLLVEEGSPVSKGKVLAEINETDYRLDAERAHAAMKQAEATLENIKIEFQRKEALYKEELVTRQQYDDVATRLIVARGDVDRARAGLSLAREKHHKSRLYSPLNGFVKEKKVSVGDYLRNGSPLMTVIRIDPLKLTFSVPEKDVGSLKIGQEVNFKVDSFPGREFKGKLNIIYPSLDEKTRTLQAEAAIPNKDNVLKPGLFARSTIYTGDTRDTVVVPVTSILYENERIKVFVVEGGKAKERNVKVGGKYGDHIEITEGLQGGEQLVTVGQNNLAEGSKVNVAR